MNIRAVTCWLMGAWIAGSLFMIMVATQNFRSVDRLLATAEISGGPPVKEKMSRDEARTFLRYHVSEQNRWYFEAWEEIQLALGAVTVAGVWSALRDRRLFAMAALAMFALLLAERFYITPEIVRLGRLIDFVPQYVSSPERDAFWRFHNAYSGIELTKLALGFAISARLTFGR